MFGLKEKSSQMSLLKLNIKLKLKMKMILLIGLLIVSVLLVIGLFLHDFIVDISKEQIGERALAVSESVARIPEIGAAFSEENPSDVIQSIVLPIQKATQAEFIVVGNTEEIRYAHPLEEKIGEKMLGEDNERALLYGEAYLSEATGSLGTSLRAKSPIVVGGEIVGVVSVGFLVEDIQTIIQNYTKEIWLVLCLIAIVAIIGAVMIGTYIKKLLFHFEPEEIAALYDQNEKILQSTHEGIMAIDQYGRLTTVNVSAQRLLGDKNAMIGESVEGIFSTMKIKRVLQDGNSITDEEIMMNGHSVYINLLPIQVEQRIIGAVATLRNKTEIEDLSKELDYVKQYSNALRAQTHEFSNKLHTLLGLLLLNKQEDAIRFIQQESDMQFDIIRNLIDHIADPFISGLLLGKLNVANELKIDMTIHPMSQMTTRFNEQKREALLTALGNIIDNAIDALYDEKDRKITVYFTDIADEVIFEIEDSGRGITLDVISKLFTEGFSTKEKKGHGFGLANVKRRLDEVGGTLYLEEGELGGACFIVTIPKD